MWQKEKYKDRYLNTSDFSVLLTFNELSCPPYIHDNPYLSVFILNAGKYGPEKLRIQTFFHNVWIANELYTDSK